jgi:CheY-like chemotaxis protein
MAAKRILVIEDEFLIALDISGALEQAGLVPLGPVGTVAEALGAIAAGGIDGALLDVHLSGEAVGSVADSLTAKGIPFAFVTGGMREQLPDAHRSAPLVQKPFTDKDILGAIAGF